MPTPKTWDLINATVACLQRITTTNGFYTQAGNFVSKEPGQVPQNAGLAVAAVLETLGPAVGPMALNPAYLSATVLIVGKVSTQQTDAQVRLHELIDDLQRAFDGQQALFASGLQFPRFLECKPIPPPDGVVWMGVEMRFSSQIKIR